MAFNLWIFVLVATVLVLTWNSPPLLRHWTWWEKYLEKLVWSDLRDSKNFGLIFSQTSEDHNFCSGYQNQHYFIWIWGGI